MRTNVYQVRIKYYYFFGCGRIYVGFNSKVKIQFMINHNKIGNEIMNLYFFKTKIDDDVLNFSQNLYLEKCDKIL